MRRFPIAPGDLILGDRVYANPPGIAHVVEAGGDVLVRMSVSSLPLLDVRGKRFPLLTRLRKVRIAQVQEWKVTCPTPGGGNVKGRVCALRRSRTALRRELRRLERKASRKQKKLGPAAREAAKYVFVFTTVPSEILSAADVLELYRIRWQIELSFKRLKSLVGLGHLPKYDPASSRAWLYGKLLVAFLAERLAYEASSISPWGFPLSIKEAANGGLSPQNALA